MTTTYKIDFSQTGNAIAKACDAYVAGFSKGFSAVNVSIKTMYKIVVDRCFIESGIDNISQAIQVITTKEEKELSQRVGEASAHLFIAGASIACGSAFITAAASACVKSFVYLNQPNLVLFGFTTLISSVFIANYISEGIKTTGFSGKLKYALPAAIMLGAQYCMYNIYSNYRPPRNLLNFETYAAKIEGI